MIEDLSFIGRKLDQLCIVVEDLDQAVVDWTQQYGITSWSVWEGLSIGQKDKTYWGQPGDFEFSVAYGFAGDLLIELARHDSGKSVYKDWLDERGVGPHHIGFLLEDAEQYAEAEQIYLDKGIKKAMGGYFEGGGGCRWGYFDTRATIGCYTELYWYGQGTAETMERMKRGEVFSAAPR